MRSLLLAALALATTATAQTPNYFGLWTCTNFTTRGALGMNAGDNLLKIPASHFSGIAHEDAGTGASNVTGFRHVLQDQNAATVENYDVIIRADLAGQPDCSAGGLLLSVGPFASPGGVGTLAWQITITSASAPPFPAPFTTLPQCATFYIGLALPGNANWTADGLSTHMGSYYLLNGTQAGNPAPGAPQLAHNCLGGATVPIPTNRTYRYELGTPAAIMTLWNEDPTLLGNTSNCVATASANRDFGVGGMWPENGGGRIDGLGVRVTDAENQGGVFVTFLGVGICPGFPIGFIARGALYLNPTISITPVTAITPLAAGTGIGTAAILPPGAAPLSIVNRIVDLQSITLGAALTLPGKMTNRAGVQYLP